MNESHLQDRARRAQEIIANPEEYKLCEGCESIVRKRAASCPNCNGYRFEEDPQAVILQAQTLASRPQKTVRPEDLA